MFNLLIFPLKAVISLVLLPFWYLERLIPRDKNLWVFGAWHGRRYSDNSKALYEYILYNYPLVTPYWVTREKNVYNKLKEEKKPVLKMYSLKSWWIHLRASTAVISNWGNDVNKYMLNGSKHIWLWHGMPLKKILYDNPYNYYTKNSILKQLEMLEIKYLRPYNACFTTFFATISSSDFFSPFLMSAFSLPQKKVLLTGLPRTDFLYTKKNECLINRTRRDFPSSRIILYMPTWRDDNANYNPFNEQSFSVTKFVKFLEDENIVFLYKSHFRTTPTKDSISSKRYIPLNDNDYEELYALIANIDILITDYSSIYFDFACLGKPMILTPFDYKDYISKSRDHYFDYNLLPSIKAYDWDELINIISEKKYYSLSKDKTDVFCKYNDGHASERCLKAILKLLNPKLNYNTAEPSEHKNGDAR